MALMQKFLQFIRILQLLSYILHTDNFTLLYVPLITHNLCYVFTEAGYPGYNLNTLECKGGPHEL